MVLENIDLAGTATQIVDVLLLVVVVAAGLGLLFFLMFLSKFKNKVRLRYIINGNKQITDTVAREVTDKDGITWWQTLKKQKKLPLPPGEVTNLDHKGRKCAEAYITENDDVVWIKDQNTTMEVPKDLFENEPDNLYEDIEQKLQDEKITEDEAKVLRAKKLKEWKNKKKNDWSKENNIVASFQPLTTNQRTILVNQTMKAVSRRKKGWGDKIVQLASVAILGLVIIAGMVFYGDMAEPVLKANDQAKEMKQIELKIVEAVERLENEQQQIQDQTQNKDKGAPN